MAPHICHIVPPYLLQGIALSASADVTEDRKRIAQNSLTRQGAYVAKREQRFKSLAQPRSHQSSGPHQFIPDLFLKHIADNDAVDEKTRARARRDLEHLEKVHASYQARQAQAAAGSVLDQHTLASKPKSDEQGFYRAVYDANHDEDEDDLPGKVLRVEGQQPSKDGPANEAFDNVGHVLDFYQSVFNWKSIDNENMHVVSSVHFANDYENAFWDPEKSQMVFGDGHDFLYHFTKCLDVIGHELTVCKPSPLSNTPIGFFF